MALLHSLSNAKYIKTASWTLFIMFSIDYGSLEKKNPSLNNAFECLILKGASPKICWFIEIVLKPFRPVPAPYQQKYKNLPCFKRQMGFNSFWNETIL